MEIRETALRVAMRSKSWIILLVALIGGFCLQEGESYGGEEKADLLVGSPAPSFELAQPDGVPISLKNVVSASGGVLVSFWGIRCGACIEEMGHLNILYRKYKGDGLAILGINVDGIDAATLKDFLGTMPVKPAYPVVADPELKTVDAYRMKGAPLTIFIGKDGGVVRRHEGFSPGEEKPLEAEIRGLLGLK